MLKSYLPIDRLIVLLKALCFDNQAQSVRAKPLQHSERASDLGRSSLSASGPTNGSSEYIFRACNSHEDLEICWVVCG